MADKTIGDYNAANSIDATNDYLLIEQSSVYKKINRNTLLAISSAPLGTTDTQSPTNKTFDNTNSFTIKDGSLTIQNSSSTTKQAVFSAASITAGQTRTFTFPDASGTLVTAAGTQTLTNKTITSPTISGGSIDNTTITVDSISGHTSSTIVTVANLQISNGILNSNNSVVTANITDAAITPAKLVSGTGSGWTWQSFTPSWTNITPGNGTNTGSYIQIGKTVFVKTKFKLGSTSSVGSNPTLALPVTSSSSNYTADISVVGDVGVLDAGTAYYRGFIRWSSTTAINPLMLGVTGSLITNTTISSTVPMTWATNDELDLFFCYEAA